MDWGYAGGKIHRQNETSENCTMGNLINYVLYFDLRKISNPCV